MWLNSRNVSSVEGVMVSHQWLFGHLKSFACLFSGIFFFLNVEQMHRIFDATLTLSVECCLLSFSCDTFFQWCFTCAFSLLPPRCVHHQISIVSPLPHTISLAYVLLKSQSNSNYHSHFHYTLWRKKWCPQKEHKIHIKGLVFSRTFSSVRSPHSCLLHLPQ